MGKKTAAYQKARTARLKEGKKLLKERVKLTKEEVKLTKAELASEKYRDVQKRKRAARAAKWKKRLTKKFTSKPILKKQGVTVSIKEHESAPYIPIHMKDVIKEDKRRFFFK